MRIRTLLLCCIAACLPLAGWSTASVRVKDLAQVEGMRTNPLLGYGLVVGLQGSGDGTQSAFTIQSLANLLKRSGVTVPPSSVRVRNIAAVMVTAELQPFSRPGQQLDVQVSSIGDAKSLQGGTLLMTPLYGPDGGIYAVAQGSVSIGGAFLGGSGGNSVQKNHPTAGRIPAGATVEREVPYALAGGDSVRLLLRQGDFATASRIAAAINDELGAGRARAEDPVSVRVSTAGSPDAIGLLARVQAIEVQPDVEARIVINERTGTVVVGREVRISTAAVAHGNLTVEVRTDKQPSQPAPLSEGETVVVEQRRVYVDEGPDHLAVLPDGVAVGEVVDALNVLGVSPRDMIAIFQALEAAGALHARLVLL